MASRSADLVDAGRIVDLRFGEQRIEPRFPRPFFTHPRSLLASRVMGENILPILLRPQDQNAIVPWKVLDDHEAEIQLPGLTVNQKPWLWPISKVTPDRRMGADTLTSGHGQDVQRLPKPKVTGQNSTAGVAARPRPRRSCHHFNGRSQFRSPSMQTHRNSALQASFSTPGSDSATTATARTFRASNMFP